MINYNQIEDLLEETSSLLDKLAQLDQATAKVRQLSESISESCFNLKPSHDGMSQDLERLRRLQEVIRTYVFSQSSAGSAAEASQMAASFEGHAARQMLPSDEQVFTPLS